MQDKREQIDILFRKGLEDMEILPPGGVWNSISSEIAVKSRKKMNLAIAAAAATLIAMASSFWILTDTIPNKIAQGTFTLNQDVMPPGVYRQVVHEEPALKDDAVQLIAESRAVNMTGDYGLFLEPYKQFFNVDNLNTSLELSQIANALIQNDYHPGLFPKETAGTVIYDMYADVEDLSEIRPGNIDRWYIGAVFSTSQIMRSATSNPELKSMMNAEKMFLTHSGGLSVLFNISRKISISTGLYYSAYGQMIENMAAYSGFSEYAGTKGPGVVKINTSAGNIVSNKKDYYFSDRMGDRVTSAYGSDFFDPVKEGLPYSGNSLIQNFNYFELPLMVRYKLIDRIFDLNLLSGVSYSLLTGNNVNLIAYNGEKIHIGQTEGINPFTIIGSMGVGMGYSLTGSLSLSIEPVVRYNLSSFGYHSPFANNPWSVGFYSGLYFRF